MIQVEVGSKKITSESLYIARSTLASISLSLNWFGLLHCEHGSKSPLPRNIRQTRPSLVDGSRLTKLSDDFKSSFKEEPPNRSYISPSRCIAENPRVCIVGAGLARLRCAEVLLEEGVEVTILEARDGLSGRVGLTRQISGISSTMFAGSPNGLVRPFSRYVSPQYFMSSSFRPSQLQHESISVSSTFISCLHPNFNKGPKLDPWDPYESHRGLG